MGLLNKFLKTEQRAGVPSVPPSGSSFQDSGAGPEADGTAARMAVRRELVQVTLRETMRRHAVPSDWLEVRMLPVVTRKRKNGLHVQLVVRQGQGSLLTYIPSFQSSFMAEMEKFDPRAWEWLLSISWQFAAITSTSAGEMPGATDWRVAVPGGTPATSAAAVPSPGAAEEAGDDVEQDLQALFAIRDAALQGGYPMTEDRPEFEPTQPGAEGR